MTLLSPTQIASETDLSPITIRRLCASGELRATKLGGQWRIYEDSYIEWLQAGEPEPGVKDPQERPRGSMRALVEAS